MGSASDYLENKLLDHVLGKTSYTMPTVYVALCTAAPTDADTGSTITEVSGGSYARKSTAGADWNAASSGATDNANAITFVQATADWGTVTHFALLDASTAGNMLMWGALDESRTVLSGDTVTLLAGSLDVTAD